MKLIIAEKPSVARDLVEVLGTFKRQKGYYESDEYVVSWCIGHMAALLNPGEYKAEWLPWDLAVLPMIPQKFKLKPQPSTMEHWQILKGLLQEKRFKSVINACDAGREGELIFRYVYEMASSNIPMERLWLSSMTKGAIETAFSNIKPASEFDDLHNAARSRSEADWLVGMNASRAMSIYAGNQGYRGKKTLGRVQTPTLAMIVDRDQEIANHQPQQFFQMFAEFRQNEAVWEAVLVKKETENRIFSKQEAQSLLAEIQANTEAKITTIDAKDKDVAPPALYDLSTLQREANLQSGLTAQETLTAAQGLYEQKFLSYPRTDSRHLPTDMKQTVGDVLNVIHPQTCGLENVLLSIKADSKQIEPSVFNDGKITDHYAIIPTEMAVTDAAKSQFSAHQVIIYELVVRRFVGQFLGKAVFSTAKIETQIGQHQFVATGQFLTHAGWQLADPPHSKKKEKHLPMVVKGKASLENTRLQEGKTKPPPQYNEASLLGAMESAGGKLEEKNLRAAMKGVGLGTAATRANIIETLINRTYIERQQKNLVATLLGQQLIKSLPIDDLKSPILTASWEADLLLMEEGKCERDEFMKRVHVLTERIVKAIPSATLHFTIEDSLGDCPVCRKPVLDTGKVYSCITGRDCSFVIFHEVAQKKITKAQAKKLIAGHVVGPFLDGFTSRAGKKFSASLALDNDGRVQFQFEKKEGK